MNCAWWWSDARSAAPVIGERNPYTRRSMILPGFREKLLAAFLLLTMLAYFSVGSTQVLDPDDIRSSCWAPGSTAESVAAIAQTSGRWSCSGQNLSIEAERVLLRFDMRADRALPRYFLSRRSALKAVHVLAVDGDGAIRESIVPASALASSMAGGYFKVPLPKVTRATRQVVVAVDLPSHRMTLENAYLAPRDAAGGVGDMQFLLILAGLGGMLVMPLFFNAAFYRALREPFVLWHSALALSLLMTILVSSGLSVMFFDPPAMTLNWMTAWLFGMTIASGTMFTYSFIEPGLMHRTLRRLLPGCAAWAIALSAFHATFPFVARPIQSSLYTAAFAPVLAIFIVSMIDALRRGSRAAKFQTVGYMPMVLVGLIRLATGLLPWSRSFDAMVLFYVGCICEVLFTTLGMADRFVTMRRERDRALSEADVLERLSETDPLTGLLNRRAIKQQFERLRTQGFTKLAVIDLDNFKAINDLNGHAVGDAVLRAVADALQAGPGVRAYRFGGEEFVLLLRGDDAEILAERLRKTIPSVVSRMVAGLEGPVTASMGVTDILADEGFAKPYERADNLLYAAKRAGKNQTRSAIGQSADQDIPAARTVSDLMASDQLL
ncbi:diguanylate cyclase [Novosphingobium sp. BL-8H]|uniref:GGDEF domain-containing protein n=1 Tax=Novosphingobium sp. BL-8H TaxID=3127640 RepID=UPI0037568972